MAGRRRSTPLFEIMSRTGNGTVPSRPPEPGERPAPAHIEAKPSADRDDFGEEPELAGEHEVEHESGHESGHEAPAHRAPARQAGSGGVPRTMGRISVASGTVRMPVNYAYMAISGVLVIVLGTWIAAYFFGSKSAEERARREIESATGAPHEVDGPGGLANGSTPGTRPSSAGSDLPSDNRGQTDRGAGGGASPAGGVPGVLTGAGMPAVTQTRTRFLVAGGFFSVEPRTEGMNYLCLVSRLPEADAARALEFLARNGVAAMGVETERSTPNNRSFALYTLVPIASENFRDNTDRKAHESLMKELGRRWRSDERGTSDFSQPQWYLFRP